MYFRIKTKECNLVNTLATLFLNIYTLAKIFMQQKQKFEKVEIKADAGQFIAFTQIKMS